MNTDEGLPVGTLPGDRKHMGKKSQRLAASPLQVSLLPVHDQLIFLLFLPFWVIVMEPMASAFLVRASSLEKYTRDHY